MLSLVTHQPIRLNKIEQFWITPHPQQLNRSIISLGASKTTPLADNKQKLSTFLNERKLAADDVTPTHFGLIIKYSQSLPNKA